MANPFETLTFHLREEILQFDAEDNGYLMQRIYRYIDFTTFQKTHMSPM